MGQPDEGIGWPITWAVVRNVGVGKWEELEGSGWRCVNVCRAPKDRLWDRKLPDNVRVESGVGVGGGRISWSRVGGRCGHVGSKSVARCGR